MTLQQIKDSLPKYCCLTSPDIAKEGDVVAVTIKEKGSRGGEIAYEECEVVIRPIPDEVLENQAFWVLYNKLATVAPNGEGFDVCYHKLLAVYDLSTGNGMNGKRLFESQDAYHKAIPLLGGEQNIIKQLSAGDLYSKWIGDQIA